MGIDRIYNRQYKHMMATNSLGNLDGIPMFKGKLRYIRRSQFSKQQLVGNITKGSSLVFYSILSYNEPVFFIVDCVSIVFLWKLNTMSMSNTATVAAFTTGVASLLG